MTIRRYAVQDGVFTVPRISAHGAPEDIANAIKESFRTWNRRLQDPLGPYVRRCDEILRARGYPIKWEELRDLDRGTLPLEVKEVIDIKFYLIKNLEGCIAAHDAQLAVFYMGELHERLMRIETRPLAPLLRDGKAMAEGRVKGGRATKGARGIMRVVERLVDQYPDWTARQCWEHLITYESNDPLVRGEFEIYGDGKLLIQVGIRARDDKALRFVSFQRYVTRARKDRRGNRSN